MIFKENQTHFQHFFFVSDHVHVVNWFAFLIRHVISLSANHEFSLNSWSHAILFIYFSFLSWESFAITSLRHLIKKKKKTTAGMREGKKKQDQWRQEEEEEEEEWKKNIREDIKKEKGKEKKKNDEKYKPRSRKRKG